MIGDWSFNLRGQSAGMTSALQGADIIMFSYAAVVAGLMVSKASSRKSRWWYKSEV